MSIKITVYCHTDSQKWYLIETLRSNGVAKGGRRYGAIEVGGG